MSFQTKVYTPIANSTSNNLSSEVVGNKTDAAIAVVGTTASEMAYIKGILNTVLSISGAQTEVQIYGSATVDVDNVGHVEACIVDKDVGLIPLANITAGTYTLKRIRAGISTDIAVGSAWSKSNGRVYSDITFPSLDWDTDDTFVVVPLGDTTYTVNAVIYYPAIPTLSGIISDLSTIEGKIDAIQTDVEGGTAAVNRLSGKTQTISHAVTIAANAANTVMLTATTQPVLIKSLICYAVAAQTGNLTKLQITSNAGDVVVIIPDTLATQANLDAAGKQLASVAPIYLPTGATIDIDPTGTGATALDLLVVVEYISTVDGGYLA